MLWELFLTIITNLNIRKLVQLILIILTFIQMVKLKMHPVNMKNLPTIKLVKVSVIRLIYRKSYLVIIYLPFTSKDDQN